MSAPSSPHRPDDPTVWSRSAAPGVERPAWRSRCGAAVDVVARIGTAVTLAALLVVTGTLLTLLDTAPVPTGATTAGR